MAIQRTLLALAAISALALVFLLPRIFEETDEARVPPVELRRFAPDQQGDRPSAREQAQRRAERRRARAAPGAAAAARAGAPAGGSHARADRAAACTRGPAARHQRR